jgi:DNA-binding PadR family transcriptional regulator
MCARGNNDFEGTGLIKGMVKADNYIVLLGSMVTELNLKGSELIIFAIIHGFSQTEGSYFSGSLKYLQEWTNTSKQSVINNLNSLVEKGYIEKIVRDIEGVKKVYYRSKKLTGVVKKVDWGGQKSLPNNIEDNIVDDKKEKQEKHNPRLEEIKDYVKEKGFHFDPQAFFDHYEASNWHDKGGHKITYWKQNAARWENNWIKKHGNSQETESDFSWRERERARSENSSFEDHLRRVNNYDNSDFLDLRGS